jgi:hypothetical protein
MFREIAGWLDGSADKLLVYTIPWRSGFVAIEGVIGTLQSRFPSMEWYYGNVYDSKDGITPLNWWEDLAR